MKKLLQSVPPPLTPSYLASWSSLGPAEELSAGVAAGEPAAAYRLLRHVAAGWPALDAVLGTSRRRLQQEMGEEWGKC